MMVKTNEPRSSTLGDVARTAASLLANIDTPPWSSRAAAHLLRACGAIGAEAIGALPRAKRRRAEGAFALLRDLYPLLRPSTREESFAEAAWNVALGLAASSETTGEHRAAAARVVLALWTACPPTVEHCRVIYRSMNRYGAASPSELRMLLEGLAMADSARGGQSSLTADSRSALLNGRYEATTKRSLRGSSRAPQMAHVAIAAGKKSSKITVGGREYTAMPCSCDGRSHSIFVVEMSNEEIASWQAQPWDTSGGRKTSADRTWFFSRNPSCRILGTTVKAKAKDGAPPQLTDVQVAEVEAARLRGWPPASDTIETGPTAKRVRAERTPVRAEPGCARGPSRVVHFPHPGREPDVEVTDAELGWNTTSKHRRKFLYATGASRSSINAKDDVGPIAFWGEWEAESRIARRWDEQGELPSTAFEPFWRPKVEYAGVGLQNTDPFVFGDAFVYGNCKQYNRGRPGFLSRLEAGDLVLFGSKARDRVPLAFVLDTVLVVRDATPYELEEAEALEGKVPPCYRDLALRPLANDGRSYDHGLCLYRGATPSLRVDDMFSFVPCLANGAGGARFARPTIELEGYVNPRCWRGPRRREGVGSDEVKRLWQAIVDQVLDAKLRLGVQVNLPRRETT